MIALLKQLSQVVSDTIYKGMQCLDKQSGDSSNRSCNTSEIDAQVWNSAWRQHLILGKKWNLVKIILVEISQSLDPRSIIYW